MSSARASEADEPDGRSALQVELSPEQIEWLEQQARGRTSSVSAVIRTILSSRMHGAGQAPATERRETIDAEPGGEASEGKAPGREGPRKEHSRDGDSKSKEVNSRESASSASDRSNLVDRLRSASERLGALTEAESTEAESSEPDASDPDEIETSEFLGADGVLSRTDADSDLKDRARRFAEMGDETTDENSEEAPRTIATDVPDRSMFEMVEE
jgi:hypothetical protein